MGEHTFDTKRSPAMRRNAIAFTAFMADCLERGLKVTVGLSGTKVAEDDQPHDLVVCVRGQGVNLAERVTGDIRETILLLRRQIGMVAP